MILKTNSGKATLFRVSFLPNFPIIIALIILFSTPFLILYNEERVANTFAGYALSLLIVGVLGKIILSVINKESHKGY